MMSATTRLETNHPSATVEWLTGMIVDCNDECFQVSIQQDISVCEAKRAFGCLVQPAIGDMVCLLRDEYDQLYVTTVLQRETDADHKPAAATVSVPGRLNIQAPAGLSLKTDETMDIQAEKLQGKVSELHWWSKLMRVTGNKLLVNMELSRLTSRLTEVLAQRMQVNAERSYRNISEAEHLRAGVLDMKAEQLAHIRAECMVMTGKKLVKVDASQVHIG